MTRMQSVRAIGAHAVLICAAVAAAGPASAQTGVEPRVWTAVSVQGRAGQDSAWRWAADSLLWTRNGARTMDFVAEGLSVSRDLTPQSSLGIGYAYGAAFPDGGSMREHRFVQQYAWSAGSAWRVSLRTRLEERFIAGHDTVVVRMRQQVRTTWPLAAGGALRGVVSGELFLRANSSARGARGFESDRVFVGIGRQVTERRYVELGYVNLYSPRSTTGTRRGHAMSATLVLSM